MGNRESLRQALVAVRDSPDKSTMRGAIISTVRQIPKAPENTDLFKLGFELLEQIDDPVEKRIAVLDFVKEIPSTEAFLPLYTAAIDAAIVAADSLDENQYRITELLRIAGELPKTDAFLGLRVLAWRLALGLPDRPRFREPALEKLAKELPKSLDYTFYRRYTLLGVAKEVPREGPFIDVYREAIRLAIKASCAVEEPYYRRYALFYIADELKAREESQDLYSQAIKDAYQAAVDTKDPFAREHALVEVLQKMPKTPEFFPLLQSLFENALTFFTVRKWMDDIEVFDVVDYILSAEELGIKESKKNRFTREKYAKILSSELDKFGGQLSDTRFIDTLRPYTHVWVQPKRLRDSVKKVVEHLESLQNIFHGKEMERPVFLKEFHPDGKNHYIHKKEENGNECIAIDLGATNTVIMKKKGRAQPDFIALSPISRRCDRTYVIPTVLGAETNAIGAEVTEESPIAGIKQMLLEGNPKGREHMERFVRILYQHLKKATVATGWYSIIRKNISDVLYITVPVGYQEYREAMREITSRVIKGVKIEFIEEPLAAAVAYEVVEEKDKVIMVIDFGGSTLNTMVLRINIKEVHVIAKPERAQILGGHDIDRWLASHLAKKAGIDPGHIPYRLLTLAEEMKIELSKRKDAPFEWDGRHVCRISREEFEEVLDRNDFYRFIDRTVSYVLRRAEKVGFRKERIEAVLLTGGSSQIPSFKEKIGHIFPALRGKNLIFDHSPLTAVGLGAALYGTRDITDRHLGMAYAVRYATGDKGAPYSYSIVLEKGELLPLEKSFRVNPARKLGAQNEIFIELYEVPDSLITRRWVMEGGIEFLKQELENPKDAQMNAVKTISLAFREPLNGETGVTFSISESGQLNVIYGPDNTVLDTGIRLQ